MINKFVKYNEANNPFAKIKDYCISNIAEFESDLISIFYSQYKPYMEYNIEERVPLFKNITQYKKYLNNLFINRLIMIVCRKNNQDLYVTYLRVKKLSIDKEGNLIKFYDDKDTYRYIEEYNAYDVEKYVEILKSLEGQKITFTKRNPRIKINGKYAGGECEVVDDFDLSKVYIDKHDNIFFVNKDGESFRVNIFRSIKKHQTQIFTAEDPYGEEDWDEFIEENKILRFDEYGLNEGRIGRGIGIVLLSLLPFVNSFGQEGRELTADELNAIWNPPYRKLFEPKTEPITQDIRVKIDSISSEILKRADYLHDKCDIIMGEDRKEFRDLYKQIVLMSIKDTSLSLKYDLYNILRDANVLFQKYNKFPHRYQFRSIKELNKISTEIEYFTYTLLNPVRDATYSDYIVYYNKLLHLYSEISDIEHPKGVGPILDLKEQILFGIASLIVLLSILWILIVLIGAKVQKGLKKRRIRKGIEKGTIKPIKKEDLKKIDPYGEEEWDDKFVVTD